MQKDVTESFAKHVELSAPIINHELQSGDLVSHWDLITALAGMEKGRAA